MTLAHADSLARGVLHRDISINNLMLYYCFAVLMSDSAVSDCVEENAVPLAGRTDPASASQEAKEVAAESRLRNGLLVDFDYAMLTDGKTFTFKGTVSVSLPWCMPVAHIHRGHCRSYPIASSGSFKIILKPIAASQSR